VIIDCDAWRYAPRANFCPRVAQALRTRARSQWHGKVVVAYRELPLLTPRFLTRRNSRLRIKSSLPENKTRLNTAGFAKDDS